MASEKFAQSELLNKKKIIIMAEALKLELLENEKKIVNILKVIKEFYCD